MLQLQNALHLASLVGFSADTHKENLFSSEMFAAALLDKSPTLNSDEFNISFYQPKYTSDNTSVPFEEQNIVTMIMFLGEGTGVYYINSPTVISTMNGTMSTSLSTNYRVKTYGKTFTHWYYLTTVSRRYVSDKPALTEIGVLLAAAVVLIALVVYISPYIDENHIQCWSPSDNEVSSVPAEPQKALELTPIEPLEEAQPLSDSYDLPSDYNAPKPPVAPSSQRDMPPTDASDTYGDYTSDEADITTPVPPPQIDPSIPPSLPYPPPNVPGDAPPTGQTPTIYF